MFTFTPPIPPIRSRRARQFANWLGLRDEPRCDSHAGNAAPELAKEIASAILPAPGRITLITGPSGSGKSSLLSSIRRTSRIDEIQWIDLDAITPPNVPLVDCFPRASLTKALKHLGRVGLAEAWTCLRTPRELSDGQRWRLKLALALHDAGRRAHGKRVLGKKPPRTILCADEFAAVLDRVTAMILARALRRALHARTATAAILATSHDDLTEALQPDVIVRCDFGTLSLHPQWRGQPR